MIKKSQFLFWIIFSVFLLSIGSGCKKSTPSKSEYPKSIVALSPSSVEILFAIEAGNQIAALSDLADYPPEATDLPKVGGFDGKTLSFEKILSYKPDLVYLTDGMHNFLIQELEANEIPYFLSKANSINDVENEILEVGKITGHENESKILVTEMRQKIGAFRDPNAQAKFSVYYEVWNSPFMSVGNSSFISDVITNAGGKNIFADLSEAYPMVSEETIIARQPDVILLPASSGISAQSLATRPGWSEIPAVKNNRVYVIDDNVFGRPGPRIADAVLQLEDLLR